MTRSNYKVDYYWEHPLGFNVVFDDGRLISSGPGVDFTYASALNLASKLLQWATNLPESEKGNVHKINGEWLDVDE